MKRGISCPGFCEFFCQSIPGYPGPKKVCPHGFVPTLAPLRFIRKRVGFFSSRAVGGRLGGGELAGRRPGRHSAARRPPPYYSLTAGYDRGSVLTLYCRVPTITWWVTPRQAGHSKCHDRGGWNEFLRRVATAERKKLIIKIKSESGGHRHVLRPPSSIFLRVSPMWYRSNGVLHRSIHLIPACTWKIPPPAPPPPTLSPAELAEVIFSGPRMKQRSRACHYFLK